MFTGIIEDQADLLEIKSSGTNKTFLFQSKIAPELKIDQSIAHNGVCLTIESLKDNQYTVTAIEETLNKTNLNKLKVGDQINLERCLSAKARFDGHIVQGHVDQIGILDGIENKEGSYLLKFRYDSKIGNITVEKGSICVNGISLTVLNSNDADFTVAIIPYTWEHTNLHRLKLGDAINLEFDILGKYIQKILEKRK